MKPVGILAIVALVLVVGLSAASHALKADELIVGGEMSCCYQVMGEIEAIQEDDGWLVLKVTQSTTDCDRGEILAVRFGRIFGSELCEPTLEVGRQVVVEFFGHIHDGAVDAAGIFEPDSIRSWFRRGAEGPSC